jgi:small-conductance mechanosensitive channel
MSSAMQNITLSTTIISNMDTYIHICVAIMMGLSVILMILLTVSSVMFLMDEYTYWRKRKEKE